MFAIIMAYIWKLRFTHPRLWIPAMALILASHLARHERAAELGFRAENFWNCLRRFGPALVAFAAATLGAAVILRTLRPIGFEQAMLSFALYLPWGLFQQYLLNGYFLRRFEMAFSPPAAAIFAASLFGLVHSPNWFLMAITPAGAYVAIRVYRRYRNLYFLGLAHAIIGILLFLAVEDSVSHHLNIGPARHTAAQLR